ncbi:MAG: hypothetical protein OEZ13_08485 [Spirochaetia bacterium]|nr:hypothetical protein [Spirochaetia bacterium]
MIFAGSYVITPSNYLTSGLSLDTTNLDAPVTGFTSLGGTANLNLSGFTIRKGFKWDTLTLEISGTGSVDVVIKESTGKQIYSQTGMNSTQTIALVDEAPETANNGRPLIVELTFNSNTIFLEELVLSYVEMGLYGYPIPYIPSQGEMKIVYDLPADGKVDLKIYDNRGNLVKKVIDNEDKSVKFSPKSNIEKWDGKNERGNKVSSGVYNAVIKVEFSDSSLQNYTSVFRFVVLR